MYLTFYKELEDYKKELQLSIEDFLNGVGVLSNDQFQFSTTTRRITIDIPEEKLKKFYDRHFKNSWFTLPKRPEWNVSEIKNHYSEFFIPKSSGGMRKIDAPDEELKEYLTNLKNYFERVLRIVPNEAAHAYVQKRSTITALKEHQNNNSNWFLKMDMKDFFPSHSFEYVWNTLKTIYPIGLMMNEKDYAEELEKALEYAFLDGGLPQGTPLSPTLTNICMIPIDNKIKYMCWGLKSNMCYTRYADDLLISSPYKFDYKEIENNIKKILEESKASFYINNEKTRFGSKSGKNWNLGLMLNKDNNITVGHKAKHRFKALLHNIIMDYKNDTRLSYTDKQIILGQIAYYKMIEPETINNIIKKYEKEFDINIKNQILNLKTNN